MAAPLSHAVTGAYGFTGKHLARRLLDAGKTVITLTGSPDRPNPFGDTVKARPYRFGDIAAMAEELAGVEVLYNTYWVRFNHKLFSHADAVANTLALFKAASMAGVRRIVHVSITQADPASPLEYFRGKGELEEALRNSGLSYAILRPAVLFGPGDILVNNMAWTLRHFPVFGLFGKGDYRIQPIHVDDLAALMAEQGEGTENTLINAVGEEDYSYRELVELIGREIGKERPILPLPPFLGYLASLAIGKVMGDVFITRPEIKGLMADTLHAPGVRPIRGIRLSAWLRENRDSLGLSYASELARRKDRKMAY